AIALATERGRESHVPMPVATRAAPIVIEALNRGGADKASGLTVRLHEEAAGVPVRAPDVAPETAATFISTQPETDRDR
ncbi:MAG: NAD(P)-dependent oxidoreductase, partial [Candidatus Entotheonellia bacterium]